MQMFLSRPQGVHREQEQGVHRVQEQVVKVEMMLCCSAGHHELRSKRPQLLLISSVDGREAL